MAVMNHPSEYHNSINFQNRKARGNALFLILIGVALFAALSYAVTQTGRGGSGDSSKERGDLGAARLMNYATMLDNTVSRLTVTSNTVPYNLSFQNNASKRNDNTSPNGTIGSPADPSLYVFDPGGGALTAQTFADLAKPCGTCDGSALKLGHFSISWKGLGGVGTTTADLTLYIAYISDEVCKAINKRAGVVYAGGIPGIALPATAYVQGTPPAVLATTTDMVGAQYAGSAAAVSGKLDFCAFEDSTVVNRGNKYFHVIVIN